MLILILISKRLDSYEHKAVGQETHLNILPLLFELGAPQVAHLWAGQPLM